MFGYGSHQIIQKIMWYVLTLVEVIRTDYSAFHIIDVESLEQVAEYKGRMSTRDYGNLLVNISTRI